MVLNFIYTKVKARNTVTTRDRREAVKPIANPFADKYEDIRNDLLLTEAHKMSDLPSRKVNDNALYLIDLALILDVIQLGTCILPAAPSKRTLTIFCKNP